MRLTPRYGPTAIIALDGDPAAVAEPCIRQRRRFLAMIQELTEDEWAHPSRCDGWSARDVAVHLASTNGFWEASIRLGVDGAPTEMLATFDPVRTPARMVADSTMSTDEIVETFATSSKSLADLLLGLRPADWIQQAEAPPGHVNVSAVVHHALWDAWIHERDIALPLGRTPQAVPDEVIASLRYVAALTPALALVAGAKGGAGFDVSVSDPDANFHVEVAADVLVTGGTMGSEIELLGSSVDLLEALSFRRPLDQVIPPELDWAFAGLGAAFDR
ncbi:MAG TPA: maleylpyruvate isomerase family mycothiol-dependent enzyme [Ilumatobacteraceae bacterium]|nr:maleylpyruvate isomerase family mycothiol-dependent enzyme [Ilumatobacteraceae bacterium]